MFVKFIFHFQLFQLFEKVFSKFGQFDYFWARQGYSHNLLKCIYQVNRVCMGVEFLCWLHHQKACAKRTILLTLCHTL